MLSHQRHARPPPPLPPAPSSTSACGGRGGGGLVVSIFLRGRRAGQVLAWCQVRFSALPSSLCDPSEVTLGRRRKAHDRPLEKKRKKKEKKTGSNLDRTRNQTSPWLRLNHCATPWGAQPTVIIFSATLKRGPKMAIAFGVGIEPSFFNLENPPKSSKI